MDFFIKFAKGYVEVEVTGFAINRFLNLCTTKKIKLWDLKFIGSKLYCSTSIKSFYLMKSLGKKSGCKVRIKKKKGIPFLSFRYRKRKILLYGTLFFLFTIYFLSSFIWYIDISGNEHISNYQLIEVLEKENAKVGYFKAGIDNIELEKVLQKAFPTITWVSVFQEGTTLVVQVSESLEQTLDDKESKPTSIYAKKDGVVVYTKTSKGTQVVNIGDVVKEGDLLVSGEIFLKEDENGKQYNYVEAISEVRANTTYNFEYTIEKNKIIEHKSGKNKKNYKLYLFGKTYDFFKKKINYEFFDKTTERTQLRLSEKYLLPIVIVKENYEELIITKKPKTEKEILEESEVELNKIITGKFDTDVDIISKEINLKKTSQNIVVYSIIGVTENIAVGKPIDIKIIEPIEQDYGE